MEANFMYNNVVTNEDYLSSTGIDLNSELTALINNDIGDAPADRFIAGIEDWCKSYLQERYTFDGTIQEGNQRERFKKGIIYQIQYVIRNGNISNDSGYVASTGFVVDPLILNRIGMAPNALREFKLGGMANLVRY